MKRFITLLLTLVITISFVGCKKEKTKNQQLPENGVSESDELVENEKDKNVKENSETDTNKNEEKNNDIQSNKIKIEEPSKKDMKVFESYLEKVQEDKDIDEKALQKELAETHKMSPEEVKETYLKVWQYKIEQAEALSD